MVFQGLPRAIVILSVLRPSKKFLPHCLVEAVGLINLISEIPSKMFIEVKSIQQESKPYYVFIPCFNTSC